MQRHSFLAAVIGAAVFFVLLRRWNDPAFRRAAMVFLLSISVAPLLWLAYNAAVYGNPLEFANGPYSAKAIGSLSTNSRVACGRAGFHRPILFTTAVGRSLGCGQATSEV